MKYYFKCPKCGSDDDFTMPKEESTGIGCLLLLLVGLLPALLYAGSKCRRVQCSQCGYIFRQPSLPRTPLSNFATWIIMIVILCSFVSFVAITFSGVAAWIPEHPFWIKLEKIIVENPKAIIAGMVPMLFLIIVIAVVASRLSNNKAHKKLRQEFQTKPRKYSETREKIQ